MTSPSMIRAALRPRFALLMTVLVAAAVFVLTPTIMPPPIDVVLSSSQTPARATTQRAEASAVAEPTETRRELATPQQPLKAVVLFLYGGRWHSYFLRECLPRLDRYLLRCYPYPLHVFHEGISRDAAAAITAAVPHAPRVDFEDVGWVWKKLPAGVSEGTLDTWMAAQPKFQKRGYRIMCRFWAGVVWTLPSMDRYDYYWRLDTDSVLTRPVLVDPFAHVFLERRCEYGYNFLKGENPHVAQGLYEAFSRWAQLATRDGVLSAEGFDRVKRLKQKAIDPNTGKLWTPMFFNNFEMGSFRLKRSPVYQSFFRYVDMNEPYGILQYRWGDAPLHTLGVVAALPWDRLCNVTQQTVGYRHAAKRLEPLLAESDLPLCPTH
jgi:hypothetical protein